MTSFRYHVDKPVLTYSSIAYDGNSPNSKIRNLPSEICSDDIIYNTTLETWIHVVDVPLFVPPCNTAKYDTRGHTSFLSFLIMLPGFSGVIIVLERSHVGEPSSGLSSTSMLLPTYVNSTQIKSGNS